MRLCAFSHCFNTPWESIDPTKVEAKHGMIFKHFCKNFIGSILGKNAKNLNFQDKVYSSINFFHCIQLKMSKQENKQQRTYDLLNAESKQKKIPK